MRPSFPALLLQVEAEVMCRRTQVSEELRALPLIHLSADILDSVSPRQATTECMTR